MGLIEPLLIICLWLFSTGMFIVFYTPTMVRGWSCTKYYLDTYKLTTIGVYGKRIFMFLGYCTIFLGIQVTKLFIKEK